MPINRDLIDAAALRVDQIKTEHDGRYLFEHQLATKFGDAVKVGNRRAASVIPLLHEAIHDGDPESINSYLAGVWCDGYAVGLMLGQLLLATEEENDNGSKGKTLEDQLDRARRNTKPLRELVALAMGAKTMDELNDVAPIGAVTAALGRAFTNLELDRYDRVRTRLTPFVDALPSEGEPMPAELPDMAKELALASIEAGDLYKRERDAILAQYKAIKEVAERLDTEQGSGIAVFDLSELFGEAIKDRKGNGPKLH